MENAHGLTLREDGRQGGHMSFRGVGGVCTGGAGHERHMQLSVLYHLSHVWSQRSGVALHASHFGRHPWPRCSEDGSIRIQGRRSCGGGLQVIAALMERVVEKFRMHK